jgi:hypothetical protein
VGARRISLEPTPLLPSFRNQTRMVKRREPCYDLDRRVVRPDEWLPVYFDTAGILRQANAQC